jgi:uncharacterized protein
MKTKAPKSARDASLNNILLDDAWHREALETLRETAPFAWITGGFVRNAIWDAVFDKQDFCIPADVDVIYLGPRGRTRLIEQSLSASLIGNAPEIRWSVKDQSRMHVRSSDSPYRSLNEALRAFPDRSSAIAVRLLSDDSLETLAPYGLQDAFRGIVRPTPAGRSDERYRAFLDRKLAGWRKRWPHLMVASAALPQRSSRRAA